MICTCYSFVLCAERSALLVSRFGIWFITRSAYTAGAIVGRSSAILCSCFSFHLDRGVVYIPSYLLEASKILAFIIRTANLVELV